MRKILAAGVERLWSFDTQEEADRHIENLKLKNRLFQIIFRKAEEGKIKLRVREQYNNNPLTEGMENDLCAEA